MLQKRHVVLARLVFIRREITPDEDVFPVHAMPVG
jgi:hypothetical protein